MRKNLTKKLFLSILTLAFAVVSLGASTYAWFTMSENAQINAFQGEVQAGEGIEIAVTPTATIGDAQWYTGNVPTSVVQTAYQANGFTNFAALTTINSGVSLVDYEGVAAANTTFISFYVHIKTAEYATVNLTQIYLESAGSAVEGWNADAKYNLPAADGSEGTLVNVNDSVKYKVEDAARISVNKVIYEKKTDIANNNYAGVDSEYGAYAYYNSKNQDAPLNRQTGVNYNAYTTSQLENTAFPVAPAANHDNLTGVALGTTSESQPVITFQVMIWVEGWDTECLNAIFAQTLKVQLGVALAE